MTKDKGSGHQIRPSRNTFDRKDLEAKTNTELLQAIDEMLARPVENVDGDFVDACLDILQGRAPVAENYDSRAVLGRLHEEHPALFELEEDSPVKAAPPKRRRRAVPLLRYTGAFLAAMLCLVVTANALGYNPIETFLRWVNDTIQIYSNPPGRKELPPDDPSEYHSLDEALEACGASDADRITWIPKDYSILSVRVTSVGNLTKITAIYEAERGELAIRVLGIGDTEWNGIAESDWSGTAYEHNGAIYYVTSNYDVVTKAGWKDGRYSYEISGQVSEDEMKEILNSIV